MSKQISVELNKEEDGVKAIIDIVEQSTTATVSFKTLPYFPLILDKGNLREMKKEIDIVLKKITEAEKMLNPSTIRKVVKKVTSKKSK